MNVIIIAAVIEFSLPYLPHPEQYPMKVMQVVCGTLLVGLASGIYLIANLKNLNYIQSGTFLFMEVLLLLEFS